jgi:hypothetical protein
MNLRNARRLAALGAASAAIAAVSVLAVATPASAQSPASARTSIGTASQTSEDGECDYGDFCLYYNSNLHGSLWDTDSFDRNLRNNYFVSDGGGQDKKVTNDSASYWNNSDYDVYVCKATSFTGGCKWLPAGAHGNLKETWKNNVESLYFDYGDDD